MQEELFEIKDEMQRIVTGRKNRYPVMSGTIVSVDTGAMTAMVALTGDITDEGGDVSGNTPVDLNVIQTNMGGIYLIPSAEADCLVCEVDGSENWELLKAGSYDKIVIQAGTLIQFNDGSLGGMPILQKIVDNQNKILNYLTATLQPAIADAMNAIGAGGAASGPNGATSFNAAMAGQTIEWENMENTNIKQG